MADTTRSSAAAGGAGKSSADDKSTDVSKSGANSGFESQVGSTDKSKPSDPNADTSVGGPNPNQQQTSQGTGGGTRSDGTDAQGAYSREGENARVNGEPTASATVGHTVTTQTPGRIPSESGGYSPIPSEHTGDADSNAVLATQAVQRIIPPENLPPMNQAMSSIVNLPPGSRPMMLDPATGLGVRPPQQADADAEQAAASTEAKTAA